jgi:hypothetical protein
MKLTTLAFLVALLVAHSVGDADKRFDQPLSMFRDGPDGVARWLGYLLFGLLLLAGGLLIRTLHRARRFLDVGVFRFAAGLLLLVAVTPSLNGDHELCSFFLLALLYFYYAALLYSAGSVWLVAHLPVPAALLLLTRAHSFGLWQKALILYFLLAITAQHHLLTQWVPAPRRGTAPRTRRPALPSRRRIVFNVQPGKAWARRG